MARKPTVLEIPVEDTPQFRFVSADSAAVSLVHNIVNISLFNDHVRVENFKANVVDESTYSIGAAFAEKHVRYREAVIRLNSKDAVQLAMLILDKVSAADPVGLQSLGIEIEKIAKKKDPLADG